MPKTDLSLRRRVALDVIEAALLATLTALAASVAPSVPGLAPRALLVALPAALLVALLARLRSDVASLGAVARLDALIGDAIAGNYNARFRPESPSPLDAALDGANALVSLLEETRAGVIRSEAARKSLLSDISHDIRTPLTSIIGYIDALKDDIASDGAERDEYVAILDAKSRALKAMVEDVFHLAKLDADDIPMRPERLDACEVAREALIEFLPAFRSRGIDPVADIPDESRFVVADRLSLERMIRNLIQNALQHGGECGYVRVRVETGEGGAIAISVADRGRGISADDLPRVFDRLYRRDAARGSLALGSGLGLAIVQRLAEKNGAVVSARSERGAETAFEIVFPPA